MTELALRRLPWRRPLTALATIAAVALLVRDFGGRGVVSALVHARPGWVAAAFGAACACVVLGALRWKLVLAAMGCPLGLGRALHVVLATWPPAVGSPSRANELLRAFAVRDVVPLAAGAGSVLAERAVDLLVLLALASLGVAARGLWAWSAALGGLAVVETAALALLSTRRRWLERLPGLRRPGVLDRLFHAFDALRRSPGRLASVAAVSLGIRLLTVAVVHALLIAVGLAPRAIDTLTLWPAATLAGLAPVTLGGMGTRDATFIYLLEASGAEGARAAASGLFAATMAYSVVAVWSFALIGLPFMVREVLGAGRPARAEGLSE